MKQTEHAAARLIEWLADFKALAVERGKMTPTGAIYVGLFQDGTGTITITSKTFGSIASPIQEALDRALDWLVRDTAAEQNATLGLNADGTFGWNVLAGPRAWAEQFNYQEIPQ